MVGHREWVDAPISVAKAPRSIVRGGAFLFDPMVWQTDIRQIGQLQLRDPFVEVRVCADNRTTALAQ